MKMMKNNLLNNKQLNMASIYMLANLFNKAIAFITIPIFTRLLTTSEYGNVNTYLSYVLILQYFMGLSSEYTIRNAFVDYKDDISSYMASVYTLSCISSTLVSLLVLFINYKFCFFSFGLCVCCLIHSFFTFIINAVSYRLMMERKYIKRAIYIAGPNFFSVILGIIFIFFMSTSKDVSRINGYLVSYLLFGGVALISCFSKAKFRINIKYWIYIIKISPPMILHGLSVSALAQADRIMITSMRTSSETGIYSIIYNLSMVASAVTQALQGIWTPWFTEKYKEKKYEEINKRASRYLMFAAFLVVLIMFVSPEVLKFMLPESYWDGETMIPPLVLSSYFIYVYSYYVGLELHEKKTKIISIITVIATIFNIALNYFFIPHFGALAAAYTTLFSYILLCALHWYNGQRINREILKFRNFIIPTFLVTSSSLMFYILNDFWWARWGIVILICLVVLIIFKKNKKIFY